MTRKRNYPAFLPVHVAALVSVVAALVCLPWRSSQFVAMCVLSLLVLYWLPAGLRHRICLLSTAVHEAGHGAAAASARNTRFVGFEIDRDGGGQCIVEGKEARPFIIAAGYAAATLVGSCLLFASAFSRGAAEALVLVSGLMTLVTVLKARNWFTRATALVWVAVAVLVVLGQDRLLAVRFTANLLAIVLLYGALRSLAHLIALSFCRRRTNSDAERLAQLSRIPPGWISLGFGAVGVGAALAAFILGVFGAMGQG